MQVHRITVFERVLMVALTAVEQPKGAAQTPACNSLGSQGGVPRCRAVPFTGMRG